jgi:hypothetical protein
MDNGNSRKPRTKVTSVTAEMTVTAGMKAR